MGIARKYIEKKATERIPAPLLDTAGKVLIEGINRAVENRWDEALETAEETAPGASAEVKTRLIAAPIKRRMTALGAAAGATAAAPGVGTTTAVGAIVAELGVVALQTTEMVMAIGAAYGHTDASPEERRAWVLAVLAFGDDAAEEFTTLARDIGLKLGDNQALELANEAIGGGAGQVATVDALRRINQALVTQILQKWGTRKGAATLGKLLPFGIGAAVGGSANYVMLRELAKQAEEFFSTYDRSFVANMKWSSGDHDAIDVSGGRVQDVMPPPPAPGSTPSSS